MTKKVWVRPNQCGWCVEAAQPCCPDCWNTQDTLKDTTYKEVTDKMHHLLNYHLKFRGAVLQTGQGWLHVRVGRVRTCWLFLLGDFERRGHADDRKKNKTNVQTKLYQNEYKITITVLSGCYLAIMKYEGGVTTPNHLKIWGVWGFF